MTENKNVEIRKEENSKRMETKKCSVHLDSGEMLYGCVDWAEAMEMIRKDPSLRAIPH